MTEIYDSVVDRLGAFNAATEKLSKGKLDRVDCVSTAQPGSWVRLVKTEENYRVEVGANNVPSGKEADLLEMKFSNEGEAWVREIRKAERSWNVASQIEDVFGQIFNLPQDTPISVELSGAVDLSPKHGVPRFPDIHVG